MSDTPTIVRDVMIKKAPCIDGMATCRDAASLMRDEGLTYLLVNKRNDDDAWGIVSYTDLVRAVVIKGNAAEDVNVYEIMTKPVITVPADMDIRFAATLLDRVGLRCAPVDDKGELVGMMSIVSLVEDSNLF